MFLLWNVVLKCLALCLIIIIAACLLHLYACLTCSSVHASSLHPLLAHHHLCYFDVDVYFFLCIFSYLCDMLHFCVIHMLCIFFLAYVKPHFLLVFRIYLLVFFIGCRFELYKFGYIAISYNCICCVYCFGFIPDWEFQETVGKNLGLRSLGLGRDFWEITFYG